MPSSSNITGSEFESAVRRACETRWYQDGRGGAERAGRREVDGRYQEADDIVNLVEATTRRDADKVRGDAEKLRMIRNDLRRDHPNTLIRLWIITHDDPTADQRAAAHAVDPSIKVLSLTTFRSQLTDGSAYLSARNKAAFGSVTLVDRRTDPRFVKLTAKRLANPGAAAAPASCDDLRFQDILGLLAQGRTVLLLGDFGAGKSMTARECYRELAKSFHKNQEPERRFPIAINLREHPHSDDPAEALRRHARQIGFSEEQLVRGWRAGCCHTILDGFDELISSLWTTNSAERKRNRHVSTALVRAFAREKPDGVGLLITGRRNFFHSEAEMREALGVAEDWTIGSLNDFDETQVASFMQLHGIQGRLPEWIPTRPYFLAYLCLTGAVSNIQDSEPDPLAWERLFKASCQREAESYRSVTADVVEVVARHLASRSRVEGHHNRLTPQDLERAFKEASNYVPDAEAMRFLTRLGFLTPTESDVASYRFFDDDFAEAAVGIELAEYVKASGQYDVPFGAEWNLIGGDVARGICAHSLRGASAKQLRHLISKAQYDNHYGAIAVEVYLAVEADLDIAWGPEPVDITCSDCSMDVLDFTSCDAAGDRILFKNCTIGRLALRDAPARAWPHFAGCLIDFVEGATRAQVEGLCDPNCDIGEVSQSLATNNAVLDVESLTVPVRVLITVLKKLFVQRGAGRQPSALRRGMPPNFSQYVEKCTHILQQGGLVNVNAASGVVLPIRSASRRAYEIIQRPDQCNDAVIREVQRL